MLIVAIKWNHNGSVLALVGTLIVDGDVKESNVLQLYSPFGEVSFICIVFYFITMIKLSIVLLFFFSAFENP